MEKFLDEKVQSQVRGMFEGLSNPVEIIFFGDDDPARCQYCAETKQLLEEVAELSDNLHLTAYNIDQDAELAKQYKVDDVPGFVLAGREGDQILDYGIRYKGIPAGSEFSSLVNDIVLVARRDSNLAPETRKFLAELTSPVHLQVFVTPT